MFDLAVLCISIIRKNTSFSFLVFFIASLLSRVTISPDRSLLRIIDEKDLRKRACSEANLVNISELGVSFVNRVVLSNG